jgi:hypothetical protein
MASTLIQNNQAQSRVSLILSTRPGTVGNSARKGTASLSGERLARDPAKVLCLPGKFEADLSSDIGVIQAVQRSEPERR